MRMHLPKSLLLIGTFVASINCVSAIPGDFNSDGVVNVADVDLLSVEIASGGNAPAFDVNGDALAGLADLEVWVHELVITWFGDADLNGAFDLGDIVIVFAAGKYNTGLTATWAEGDWNADLVFDLKDLLVADLDGGFGVGPADVVGGGGSGSLPPGVFE